MDPSSATLSGKRNSALFTSWCSELSVSSVMGKYPAWSPQTVGVGTLWHIIPHRPCKGRVEGFTLSLAPTHAPQFSCHPMPPFSLHPHTFFLLSVRSPPHDSFLTLSLAPTPFSASGRCGRRWRTTTPPSSSTMTFCLRGRLRSSKNLLCHE